MQIEWRGDGWLNERLLFWWHWLTIALPAWCTPQVWAV
jgi:hypothetical protein